MLPEVVGEAVALHVFAVEARDAVVSTTRVEAAPPVLVARAGLLHALIVVLAAAGERGVALEADVGEDGVVQLRTEPPTAGGALTTAAWLLAGSGVQAGPAGALRLPDYWTYP